MIQRLELKILCSLILRMTINDPDKYQSGLTKIFFRAGMLAALESLRSDRLNYLVTVVQKNMLRHMAVTKYRAFRAATIKVQTWWRGVAAKKFVAHIRREVAAIRLQKAVRRFVQRRGFLHVRRAVIALQSRKHQNIRSQRLLTLLFQEYEVLVHVRGTTSNDGTMQRLCCKVYCGACERNYIYFLRTFD